MAFFDTKDGPIVLELPPASQAGSFNGNIVNVWQTPLEDAGLLGADKGAGGKYLIIPPNYTDTVRGLQRLRACAGQHTKP